MVISWEEYFMGVAMFSAFRSKDPKRQIGACIVNPENKIVSCGYNGMPLVANKNNDDVYTWSKEGDLLDTKYPYVVHSELNAILNARTDLRGCRIYVTLFPCNECCKAIIQSGITEVVYLIKKEDSRDLVEASIKMFENAGVKYRQYEAKGKEIKIDL
ncbi:MAG: dCMP deaminase family protein [Clostridia bacterium]|nr:dCMP deaminase family protein [Clostridia bacterium]